ncbi:MAG: sigma-70 family RNA polymerase sigma factor [Deltaproteobacteria bacterium]|nr:sigma-70 family RNA polymerase sigma factor [Deltaproteobacteria bacterium]
MTRAKTPMDALVEKYRGYAEALGRDIHRTLPHFVKLEDVHAVAREGLVAAAARFDPTRGVQFTTFGYYRIRGAVFDWVREQIRSDPYHIAKAVAMQAADSITESASEHPPATSPGDAAEQLGGILDQAIGVFSFAQAAAYFAPDAPVPSPESTLDEKQSASVLRRAVDALPDKERTMLVQVYFEHCTIEQAGQSMGLSKSWASRLHARALQLVRDHLPEEFSL